MTHTASLTYNEQLLRQAAFAFWRRTVGVVFPVILVALAICDVYLVASGHKTWETGVLSAVVAFGFMFLIALYFVHYRNGLAKFRDMGSPVAEFVAANDSFTVSSGIGSSSLKWSSIIEVWRFDGFWLLLFSKAHFMTVPLLTVSPEMQSFVLERVGASGGKIDG